jgi:hypothetical protein
VADASRVDIHIDIFTCDHPNVGTNADAARVDACATCLLAAF